MCTACSCGAEYVLHKVFTPPGCNRLIGHDHSVWNRALHAMASASEQTHQSNVSQSTHSQPSDIPSARSKGPETSMKATSSKYTCKSLVSWKQVAYSQWARTSERQHEIMFRH